jgi:putative ABC transport system permease protein
MALLYNPDEYKVLQVKYSGNHQQASQAVEKAWSTVNPDLKSDVRDFKAEMDVFYDTIFGDAVDILSVIAGLAIFISCLGLLGMVTYTTETRMKEISIRRILGSSNGGLVYLLSKDFLSLLLISILVAVPAAYFLNNFWLELMAYHVSVDGITILLGMSFLIFFGVITICSQTWRALFVNPTENLKND